MPTQPWRKIRAERSKLTHDQQAEIDAQVQADIARMRLPELRRARQLSQMTIGDILDMSQGDVSKLERRTDVYVRTLRRYVEALGGRLQIVATFPDSDPIEIEGFAGIGTSAVVDEASSPSDVPLRDDLGATMNSIRYGSGTLREPA